jgi:coproporphyrinogen III oxidase-like Fe-S oxidoreductase
MMYKKLIRHVMNILLTNSSNFRLINKVPEIGRKVNGIDSVGLYLHIPFCRQICPYCPYNKVVFKEELAKRYVNAVLKEIEIYASIVGEKPITSFYIGGGTPTTLLGKGIDTILERIYDAFNMQCEIHMESHPNYLSDHNLDLIHELKVEHLSIGVEALQDRHLNSLHRPYSVEYVKDAVRRAVSREFTCVNADFIFALPGQTYSEIDEAGHTLIDLGVDQIAAYPLFRFPYTRWAEIAKKNNFNRVGLFKRRKMLSILESIFYDAGYRRTSVWAFTKPGVPKYCSVTVPLYIGLGASGGSYLPDVLYFNTFNVEAYIQALMNGRLPIALSMNLSRAMQMAGWWYWRIYETDFVRSEFRDRFAEDYDRVFGVYTWLFSKLGMLKENDDRIVLSDRGAYWLHVLQDIFSINYISKLWGISGLEPWPESVSL